MSRTDPRRITPRVDTVLADPRLQEASRRLTPAALRTIVAGVLDRVRAGDLPPGEAADAAARIAEAPLGLRPVINATGVVLHTNLGRAPLSAAAVRAVAAAGGYTDLEYDLHRGVRRRRGAAATAALAAAVPLAEAVHVVNNNAAALMLVALVLATGREIILSRGEFVEIGAGFRIPELLTSTGARLREVGTTNRTRLGDYADAIGPDTALILRVHPANFAMVGYAASVPIGQLARLGPPVVYDVGSGLLAADPAIPGEPDVTRALQAGAALVLASGDKLLGGPQAGLIFGRAELVDRLRRHPTARAVRIDKLTLAALEATVLGQDPPVLAAIRTPQPQLRERARTLAARLTDAGIDASIVDTDVPVGGGSAPGLRLASTAVALPERYAAALRRGDPPVVGRIHSGRCLLDLRAVVPAEDSRIADAVLAVARR